MRLGKLALSSQVFDIVGAAWVAVIRDVCAGRSKSYIRGGIRKSGQKISNYGKELPWHAAELNIPFDSEQRRLARWPWALAPLAPWPSAASRLAGLRLAKRPLSLSASMICT
jgi:hypothetical protein